MSCQHTKRHVAHANVSFLQDSETFTVDLKIWCADCGVPFRFKGMRCGWHPSQPMQSVAGEEARLPIEAMDIDGPLPTHWQDLILKPEQRPNPS